MKHRKLLILLPTVLFLINCFYAAAGNWTFHYDEIKARSGSLPANSGETWQMNK
jgi:hypothetical protein